MEINGNKTYGIVGLAILVLVGAHFGYVDPAQADLLLKGLGFGGLAALRHGVKKST